MEHRIEIAPSGRATCKTCGTTIAKGELRLGEQYPSQFGSDGFAVRWHHLLCSAGKIPAILQTAMESYAGEIPNREALDAAIAEKAAKGAGKGAAKAGSGLFPSADLAPTSRAKCIHCGEPIPKATVRIAVEREVDTGSFTTKGAGYLHPLCAEAWAEEEWADGLEDLIAKVKSNTGLEALPPPFGDASPEPQGEPEAKTKKSAKKASESANSASEADAKPSEAVSKPKKAAAADASGVAFETLSAKQVASLVAKLEKLTEDYKADPLFEKTGLAWDKQNPLRWHIAAHGLLSPMHPTLLRRLGESAPEATAALVFAVVPKLTAIPKALEILPQWSVEADRILLRAMELDPARLEGLLADASPALRLGIQFVRARCGLAIDDADRAAILKGLATVEATGFGIGRTYGKDGEWLSLSSLGPTGVGSFVGARVQVEELVALFGSADAWSDALAEASKEAKFGTLKRVVPGLARLPLDVLMDTLAKPHLHAGDELDRDVLTLVTLRNDDPKALFEAARAIGRDAYPGMYIREQLLVHALARMAARGEPIAEGLEREPKWDAFSFCITPWRGSPVMRAAYTEALSGLSKERVLALVDPILARPYGQSQSLPFLAIHFDAARFEQLIKTPTEQGLSNPDIIGPIGAQALPFLLAAASEAGIDEKRKAAIAKAIRAVLGAIGARGERFDVSLDAWLSASPQENYWPEEAKAILLLSLKAMPEARRIAVLDRLFAETKQVERAFFGVHTVEDAAYREKAARLLVKGYAKVADRNTLQVGLKALGAGGLACFRAALIDEKPDAKLFEELSSTFGRPEVEAIMKSANVVEETKLTRLLRLAAEYRAANPSAPSERIYLLERRDINNEVPAARAGSFSRSRGAGASGFARGGQSPAIAAGQTFSLDQVLAMKKQAAPADPDEEHILTIDLEEVPELKKRFPDARAIALYAKNPDLHDAWDLTTLVRVPTSATSPTDGAPIIVVPIDVPSGLFVYERCEEDLALKELRELVFNRPGYVLGKPMYIQQDEGADGFLLQFSESLADVNLGDSGELYVFEGATFMQCY